MLGVFDISLLSFVLYLVFYLYFAFALQSIAKKTNTPGSWMAWIPFVNLILLANIAGMYWWPVLLIPVIYGLSFIPVQNILLSLLTLVLALTSLLYFLTYWEKTFKKVGMSQWWVLAIIVPILNFVAIGLAAWGRSNTKS
jgi:hypothetical protein